MGSFYDTLVIKQGACPPGCTACVDACARRNGGDNLGAAIKVIHKPDYHGVETCVQCGEPKCVEICPSGAIAKSEINGVVRIDQKRCVGCGLCTLACPYGGIYYKSGPNKAFKCDTCDGKPACVEACPYGVLSFIKSRPIYNRLQESILHSGAFLCVGCGVDLALRFMLRVLGGKDVILYACAGCAVFDVAAAKTALDLCLMTNIPSMMTGASRYFQKIGKDILLVSFVGDGATADVGFQPLSGAAERGEKILFMCYDNEAYQNTGIQRSSTTPFRAWTMTTQVGAKGQGKGQIPKNVPLLIAMHGVAYTATVTVSHLEDYAQKLEKAREAVKNGFVYIHILTPCPTGWRARPEDAIEMARMAVETNYFPLWEAEWGKFRLTYQPREVKPVTEFTKLQGRFRHLTKQQLDELQKIVNDRFTFLEALTKIGPETRSP